MTSTDIFIKTAGAYWRAIDAMESGANCCGSEFQRKLSDEAFAARGVLKDHIVNRARTTRTRV